MITEAFLSQVASYVDDRIAKVVLNGSYEITDFDVKQVDDATINMEFMVPNGAVSVITSIELRGEDDAVISTNSVYVPISADTIITQTIQVREG